MPLRPEARRKLEAGFQRSVDKQRSQYATQWAEAERLAVGLEYGTVVGIFRLDYRGEVRFKVIPWGLVAPLLAIPVLIAGAAVRVPGSLLLLGAWPFITGAWFGVAMLLGRPPKRRAWLYVFSEGFQAPADPAPGAISARWAQVARVRGIWTNEFNVNSEESEPVCSGYELELGDGRRLGISRSYQNVMDPYAPVGRMVAALIPRSVGEVIPRFPVVDDIIETYFVRRHLADALADFRAGRVIEHHGVALSQAGLGRIGDTTPIPWQDVDHVQIQKGSLLVYRRDSRRPMRYDLSDPTEVTILQPLLRELGVHAVAP